MEYLLKELVADPFLGRGLFKAEECGSCTDTQTDCGSCTDTQTDCGSCTDTQTDCGSCTDTQTDCGSCTDTQTDCGSCTDGPTDNGVASRMVVDSSALPILSRYGDLREALTHALIEANRTER